MRVAIRPIRPEDEPLMVKFHETLSERSVYLRYMQMLELSQRVAHERLTRMCFIDYDREMALVAEREVPEADSSEIIAVGRLQKIHGTGEAEFAIVISDDYQGKGLGAELLQRLIRIARAEGVERVTAEILSENTHMQALAEEAGFTLKGELGEPTVSAELKL